jgi:5-carboxymethyl-2-hydroxymuconate isomerase
MPHIILEYSSNLGDAGLSHLLDALGDTESFESDRIKSRAVRCDTYYVGADRRGFVHATVLFSPGRPEALRRQVGRRLLDIMRSDAALRGADVATSVEIRQFEPGMYITERDRR